MTLFDLVSIRFLSNYTLPYGVKNRQAFDILDQISGHILETETKMPSKYKINRNEKEEWYKK